MSVAIRTLAYYLDLLVWFTTHKTSRKRYWRKVQAQLRARAAAKKEDKKLLKDKRGKETETGETLFISY